MAAIVIDLDHVRRARRVLPILVERFGMAHFLAAETAETLDSGAIDGPACDDAVALAGVWIERRSGRSVSAAIEEIMRRELRRLLVMGIREGAACARG